MRLCKLRIKNIASLRGEHTISFEEVASYSSLFAITGETGAGKSTLLNAIGLALYGDIFKKTLNQIDVVTLGEVEGAIDLILSVKGKKYLASWYVRTRKNSGEAYAKTPTPTRELFTLSGDDFDAPREISSDKIENLLHLDFDQFSKCVVLNQGEFAKFLMSSFADRRAILEKLYPGEMLGGVVRVLKDELQELKTQDERISIELGTLEDGSHSQQNLEELLVSSRRELELHERWSELVEKIHYDFETLSSYHTRNIENRRRQESTRSELAAGTKVYNDLLKAAESAQELRESRQREFEKRSPELQELIRSEESLQQEKKKLEAILGSLDVLKIDEGTSTKRLGDLKGQEEKLLPERLETTKSMRFSPEEILSRRELINESLDLAGELDRLEQELLLESEKLKNLEARGKEFSELLRDTEEKLKLIPGDTKERLKALLETRDLSQKKCARLEELKSQEKNLLETIPLLESETKKIKEQLRSDREDLLTLQTTLKLQELFTAVSLCRLHPETEKKGECPVCETPLSTHRLGELRELSQGLDPEGLVKKEENLKTQVITLETRLKHDEKKLTDDEVQLNKISSEVKALEGDLPSPDKLEAEISQFQKLAWDQEKLLPEKSRLDAELTKIRQTYREARSKLGKQEEGKRERSDNFRTKLTSLSSLIPGFTEELLPELRQDLRQSVKVSELDGKIDRIRQEMVHLNHRQEEIRKNSQKLTQEKETSLDVVKELSDKIRKELGDKTATATLKELTEALRLARESFEGKEKELRKQELILKEFQARLTSAEEASRDNGVHFSAALVKITDGAASELPVLSETLTQLVERLKKLDLSLDSPIELLSPLKDVLEKEKLSLKELTNAARSKLAEVRTRKEDQERKKDRIDTLKFKQSVIRKDLGRRERLFEILGKDELRTYVLSLVEENLIHVTNAELGRLCQGRYEIVHQTKTNKLAPEFFILDKFRDGGIRKVSTLSGGETFMVSLAMALGLAEMTRGQAEIDTLFIDEGFGTLDQDSLEDVLDMLNQIQNRGLMVGLISHVKALTSTLPVNLHVQKRQDGTSSVRLLVN